MKRNAVSSVAVAIVAVVVAVSLRRAEAFPASVPSAMNAAFVRSVASNCRSVRRRGRRCVGPSTVFPIDRLFLSSPSSSASSTDGADSAATLTERQRKSVLRKQQKRSKQQSKAKRKRFIGMAKAVDRKQLHQTTYNPTFRTPLPALPEPFTVLGIESSCDDTGAAILRSDGVILGEALASQADIHEEWGGIVPALAKSAHEQNLQRVVDQALRQANMTSVNDVDAIAVTVGPGLEICLRVGTNHARHLAVQHNKPFVGVHHLEAHILMARLEAPLQFPFLALLVSGGHCQLMKCSGVGRHEILGGTTDDSLGEAFDKTARLLGLPVGGGGGPAVEALAREGDPNSVPLTVPLQRRKDCDFSYSGLKTNVRRAAEKLAQEHGLTDVTDLPHQDKANIAASFQNVAIRHIEMRLNHAMDLMEDDTDGNSIRSLALVGGVAANQELRGRLETICNNRGWRMVVPPPRLCTDQGAMSAWAGVERLKLGSVDDPTNQEVYARYPFHIHVQDN